MYSYLINVLQMKKLAFSGFSFYAFSYDRSCPDAFAFPVVFLDQHSV